MKHVGEMVKLNQTTQESQGSCRSRLSEDERRVMSRVFASMLLKYQHRWSCQFSSDAAMESTMHEWARHLAGVSVQSMLKALDQCVVEYPDYPPLVGQFVRLCKTAPDDLPLYRSLPRPVVDAEKVMTEIDKMKKALRS